MGSFTGSAVFSAALFFFCLGIIFGVVGYIGAWLEPREVVNDSITSIGVRTVCFKGYTKFLQFEVKSSAKEEPLDGCRDTTKNSLTFSQVPKEYVSPDWYQTVQVIYLASLILIFLTLVLVIGFLIAYCTLKQQIKKRRRPSSTLLLSKAALALWFILAAIAGCLLLISGSLFFKNYENYADVKFFLASKDSLKYGPGFAITFAGGASLLLSALFGLIIFVTVVRKMHRLSSGDAKLVFTDEFDNLDADAIELERLSNDDVDDGVKSEVTTKKAYPVAAPRKLPPSADSEGVSYQNIPKRQSEQRREEAAGGQQREEAAGGQAFQNIPTPRPKLSTGPQPSKRLSTPGNPDRQRDPADHFEVVNYNQPARDASPVPVGNRSMAGESMASSAYPPSTHYSYSPYMQNREPHSDSEFSQRGGRNRTVIRTNQGDNSSVASSNIPKPVVVQAGRAPDVKHSRYAAAF